MKRGRQGYSSSTRSSFLILWAGLSARPTSAVRPQKHKKEHIGTRERSGAAYCFPTVHQRAILRPTRASPWACINTCKVVRSASYPEKTVQGRFCQGIRGSFSARASPSTMGSGEGVTQPLLRNDFSTSSSRKAHNGDQAMLFISPCLHLIPAFSTG
jgi:hypothetical protein